MANWGPPTFGQVVCVLTEFLQEPGPGLGREERGKGEGEKGRGGEGERGRGGEGPGRGGGGVKRKNGRDETQMIPGAGALVAPPRASPNPLFQLSRSSRLSSITLFCFPKSEIRDLRSGI